MNLFLSSWWTTIHPGIGHSLKISFHYPWEGSFSIDTSFVWPTYHPHHHNPQQPTTMDEEGEKLQTAQLVLNSQKCSKWIILFTDAAKRPTTNPHTGW